MLTKKQKNLLFWVLNFLGWAIYGIAYFIFFRKKGDADTFIRQFLFFFTYLVGFVTTGLLRYIFRFIRKRTGNIAMILIYSVIVIIFAAFLWYWIDIKISLTLWDPKRVEEFNKWVRPIFFIQMTVQNFIPLLAWTTLYFGLSWWMEWQNEKKRAEEAINLARRSQFEMLRHQLNPHFLFNSLNSARALIDEDPGAARNMITELSEFLRYSLLDKEAFRPVRDELKALQHYLSIEKKRFEEKLQITYDADPETEERLVPGFLIHPVIENAIKYGMKTSTSPLRILIKVNVQGEYLIIRICNSGRWIEPEQHDRETGNGTGTGLTNVRKILENAYPERHIFRIEKETDKVCVIIGIHEKGPEF